MRVAILLLIASAAAVCCSAQLKKERLIARAAYYDRNGNGNLTLADSVFFKYSGQRGSRFDEGIIDYFVPQLLVDGSEIMRQGAIVNPNNVDSGYYTTCARFDTMRYYTFSAYYGRLMERMETCEYNLDGTPHIASHTYYGAPRDGFYTRSTVAYMYYFGYLTREEFFGESNTTPYYKYGERLLIRDPSMHVAIDSFDNDAIHYEYDAEGRYISRSGGYWRGNVFLDYPYPSRYDYYPDSRVRTIKEMKPSATGGYEVESYDTFTYMPGVRGYITRTYYTVPQGQPPSQYYKYSSHVNAAGLKDTIVEDWYGGWMQLYHAVAYNAFGNPVSVTTYSVVDTIKGNFSRNYYYYELYDDALNVPAVSAAPYAVAVSPNPTTGTIRLNFGNGIPPNPIAVHITNIAGQLVYSAGIALTGSTTDIVLGSENPPGVYTIRISGSNSEALYKGTIVKY